MPIEDGERRPLLARSSSETYAKTYPNQILAFYLYSVACEIYSTVALVLFLPVLLEDLARRHGFLKGDHSTPCAGPSRPVSATQTDSCEVNFLGTWIDTASFSLFVSGISLAAQVIVLISIGDFADHISTRSKLILISSLLGALSGILFFVFIASQTSIWWMAAFLALGGNVAFGINLVCLNSSLGNVTRVSRPVMRAEAELENASEDEKSELKKKYNRVFNKNMATISAQGFAFGSAAGLAILGICYIPIRTTRDPIKALSIAIGLAGVCWLIAAAIATYFNRRNLMRHDEPVHGFSIVEGWRGLFHIVRDASKLPQNFKFLIAWFILSDGFSAVTTAALLYAKTEIHMDAGQITLIGIISPICGIGSNLVLPRLASHYNISSLRMLNIIVAASTLAPLYVCLSYIPFLRRSHGFGSFSTSAEIFIFVAYFGIIAGAFESYARAIYSQLIPKRQETRFFSLFSITNKGSAFLGPFLVGICNQWTGSLRSAFIFLLITILLPLPILFRLDVDKGQQDAESFAYKSRNRGKEERDEE